MSAELETWYGLTLLFFLNEITIAVKTIWIVLSNSMVHFVMTVITKKNKVIRIGSNGWIIYVLNSEMNLMMNLSAWLSAHDT